MSLDNLESVIDFCKKELGISEEIEVAVFLDDLSEDGVKGWCHDDDVGLLDEDEIVYEIDIERTLTKEEMLLTLCHEMVHVKQYSNGQLANEDEEDKLEKVLAEKYKNSLKSF